MGWNEPSLPDIEATCDRCGRTDYIEPDNTTSGHWLYPQPEDIGWSDGEEGLLCPDCLNGVSVSDAESEGDDDDFESKGDIPSLRTTKDNGGDLW